MKKSTPTSGQDPLALYKEEAAERAVEFMQSGMTIGLGTGSTAILATRRIGLLCTQGKLHDIIALPSSKATADEASRLGIPLLPDDAPRDLDLAIDGADEVDPDLNLIKGGGGALTREKIVVQGSRRFVVVVDETKLSPQLGTRWSVPVEVLVFGWRSQARFLEGLGAIVTVRKSLEGSQFVTDSGNMILDCRFGPLADPRILAGQLSNRAGIVEHGLFIRMATDLIVAGHDGVRHMTRKT